MKNNCKSSPKIKTVRYDSITGIFLWTCSALFLILLGIVLAGATKRGYSSSSDCQCQAPPIIQTTPVGR